MLNTNDNRRTAESGEEKTYTGYEVLDGCYGTVTGRNRSGAYLELDNGQAAFAYKFANLFPGTRVLCTVLRLPTDLRNMLVSIDHVCSHAFA